MSSAGVAVPRGRQAGYTPAAVEIGLALGGGGPTAPARRALDPDADDATLVAALVGGSARALEIAYERHSRGVYSMAVRLLDDGPAAEEVVQETFLKLWRQPSAYQPSRGRLFAWLLSVAHHHAIDLLRRRQLEQRHRVESLPGAGGGDGLVDLLDRRGAAAPSDDDPQARAGVTEDRAMLGQALAALSPEQRLPLELAYYHGMTQLEIATLLGAPLGTIKTRMRLGLQQLRKAPALAQLWSER